MLLSSGREGGVWPSDRCDAGLKGLGGWGGSDLVWLFAGFAAYGQGSHDSILAIFRSVAFFSCLAGGNPSCFACMFGFQGHTTRKVSLPPVSSGAGNATKNACYSWQVCSSSFTWSLLLPDSVYSGTLSPCQSQCGLGKLWMWSVKQGVQKLSLVLPRTLHLCCSPTSRCAVFCEKDLLAFGWPQTCTYHATESGACHWSVYSAHLDLGGIRDFEGKSQLQAGCIENS